jgi:hypothetical protein
MNPDGTINTVLWSDFAQRGIHEQVLKSKALAQTYYGQMPKYSYWDGFSTGGRQAHMEAQANPTDVNGILAGAPAFNWSKFITAELYPQIVYQRDLGGVPLSSGQLTLLGNAAINACDVVGGQHLGYVPDPSECRYDPTQDPSVICAANGGTEFDSKLRHAGAGDSAEQDLVRSDAGRHRTVACGRQRLRNHAESKPALVRLNARFVERACWRYAVHDRQRPSGAGAARSNNRDAIVHQRYRQRRR